MSAGHLPTPPTQCVVMTPEEWAAIPAALKGHDGLDRWAWFDDGSRLPVRLPVYVDAVAAQAAREARPAPGPAEEPTS